jgi:hypothetical protein
MEHKQGLSLLDIAPSKEKVDVGDGQQLEVQGISSRDLLTLIQRFPEMQKFMSIGSIKATDILNMAPTTVSGIIAAACGHVGDENYEKAADRLSMEAQLNLIEAIGRCTFRSGFGPFVMRISAHVVAALSANSGRATGTNSPPPLKPSSPPDTAPTPSGT